MPNDIENQTEQPTSARALRNSLKQIQANDTHMRTYLNLGQQLFEHGWDVNTASTLLRSLCTLLSQLVLGFR
jgi:hypothetical protein